MAWNAIHDTRRRKAMTLRKRRAGYVGILDQVPDASLAWADRPLSAAMVGQPLFRLREDNGDTESDFWIDEADANGNGVLTNGSGQTPEQWRVALSATNLWYAARYDQSGNGVDLIQASAASQPRYEGDGRAYYTNAPAYMVASTVLALNSPATLAVHAEIPANSRTFITGIFDSGAPNYVGLEYFAFFIGEVVAAIEISSGGAGTEIGDGGTYSADERAHLLSLTREVGATRTPIPFWLDGVSTPLSNSDGANGTTWNDNQAARNILVGNIPGLGLTNPFYQRDGIVLPRVASAGDVTLLNAWLAAQIPA